MEGRLQPPGCKFETPGKGDSVVHVCLGGPCCVCVHLGGPRCVCVYWSRPHSSRTFPKDLPWAKPRVEAWHQLSPPKSGHLEGSKMPRLHPAVATEDMG